MQLATNLTAATPVSNYSTEDGAADRDPQRYAHYKVIRRNGAVVGFEPGKISVAVTKAFLAVNGGQGAGSARVRELVEKLAATVVNALMRRQPNGGTFHIEDIQDQVELSLMRSGEHEVAAPMCCTARNGRASAPGSARRRQRPRRMPSASSSTARPIRWIWRS